MLAPTLKTNPKPRPIQRPAYKVESKASLVILANSETFSNIAKKVGYKIVLNKVPNANFLPKYLLHKQYRKY